MIDDDAVAVDGYGDDAGASGGERRSGEAVPRVFDRNSIIRADDCVGAQVERSLGACGDQHVVGGGIHAA